MLYAHARADTEPTPNRDRTTVSEIPLDRIVDEWIYLAADHDDDGRVALVSGLTITRRAGRFEPLLSLNGSTIPNPTEPGTVTM